MSQSYKSELFLRRVNDSQNKNFISIPKAINFMTFSEFFFIPFYSSGCVHIQEQHKFLVHGISINGSIKKNIRTQKNLI